MITLLLDCLRGSDTAAVAVRLAALSASEWRALLDAAVTQQVVALLFQRIAAMGIDAPHAADTLTELQALYAANAARMLRLREELESVAAVMHTEGIPLIALKGAHLAWCIYDDPGLRQMVDLDLLVPPEHLRRAARILTAYGYTPETALPPADVPATDVLHLPPFVNARRTRIELHANIDAASQHHVIAPDALWERAVPLHIGAARFLGLSVEDLLLHTCCHVSYQHQFAFGLRPLYDIAQIIRHAGAALSWPAAVERAHTWHRQRGVHLALLLARDLVGAAVPEHVLATLRPEGFDDAIAACAREQLLTQATSDDRLSPHAVAWHDSSLAERMALLCRRTLLPRKTIAQLYGVSPRSWRVYVCYPKRIVYLITRYGRMLLGGGRGGTQPTPGARRKHVLHTWLS